MTGTERNVHHHQDQATRSAISKINIVPLPSHTRRQAGPPSKRVRTGFFVKQGVPVSKVQGNGPEVG